MSVLVTYASRHGATAGIARRIAEKIVQSGQHAEARPVARASDVDGFDAYVVGSAVYLGHWMKEAVSFVDEHRGVLAQRPVWLFSSGPLGTRGTADGDEDVRASAEPKEVPHLLAVIHPRDHQVFSGALDPKQLGIRERALRALPAARSVLPAGDFRNWPEIDEWAGDIAREMWRRAEPGSART